MEDLLKDFELPSDGLYITTDIHESQLPPFLEHALSVAETPAQMDMLFYALLTACSYAFPHLYLRSGKPKRTYLPNLMTLVVAPAGSGKGIMNLAEKLLEPIDEYLRQFDRNAIMPADISQPAFPHFMMRNEGKAFMMATEIDLMSKAWKQPGSDYSVMLRQSFEHETLRRSRMKGPGQEEQLEIKRPCLSVLLSGTFSQLRPLIPSGENGLASRFLPYFLEDIPAFDPSVLDQTPEELDVDALYKQLGDELFRRWDAFSALDHDVQWCLTEGQADILKGLFSDISLLSDPDHLNMPADFRLSGINRILVIIQRIGAILTALRLPIIDIPGLPDQIYCSDTDFHTLVLLTQKLIRHTGILMLELSKDTTPSAPLHRTTKATNLYDMLPNEFTTAEAIEIGESMGISYRTVQTWIKKYCESKQLRKLYQGKYKKL